MTRSSSLSGSKNAITYKEVFKLIQDNKLWLGNGFANGNAYFAVPSPTHGRSRTVLRSGTDWLSPECSWFTNLDIAKRHEELICYQEIHARARIPLRQLRRD